jgi:ABC-type glycerol-3-phosphate transport system substrate-binding protein
MPDVIVLSHVDLRAAAQGGLLYPLDTLLPEELAANRFPFASALGEVDGRTMGITFAAHMQHLAYRPTLFSSPPLTWTDVISSPAPLIFPAGREDNVSDFTLIQYLAAGGHLLDGEGGALLEEEPLTEVLSFYEQAVAADVISPTVVLGVGENVGCRDVLTDSQVGMAAVDSHCYWTQLQDEVAFLPLPTPDGQALSLAEGWSMALVVTPDPGRQEPALRLMEWLLAPEHLGPWTQSEGYLPGTLDGLETWDVPAEERAILEALLEGAVPVPDPTIRTVVGSPLQAAVEAVLRGRRSPAEAAADAVRAVSP